MIGTVFGGTLAADFAIFSAIIGMFGVIVKMLLDQKTLQKTAAENRRSEMKSVIDEVLNAKPDSINIQQPLRVQPEQQLITKDEHAAHCGHMERRVTNLEFRATIIERKMETDKAEIIKAGEERAIHIHNRINDLQNDVANAPARTVAMLKETKGLLQ